MDEADLKVWGYVALTAVLLCFGMTGCEAYETHLSTNMRTQTFTACIKAGQNAQDCSLAVRRIHVGAS